MWVAEKLGIKKIYVTVRSVKLAAEENLVNRELMRNEMHEVFEYVGSL